MTLKPTSHDIDDESDGSPSSLDWCEATVRVCNIKGLHARASARFVKCAETFAATIEVEREGQLVPGTSIMGLMTLAAGPGSTLRLRANGPDADAAITALSDLVRSGFGEDQDGQPADPAS